MTGQWGLISRRELSHSFPGDNPNPIPITSLSVQHSHTINYVGHLFPIRVSLLEFNSSLTLLWDVLQNSSQYSVNIWPDQTLHCKFGWQNLSPQETCRAQELHHCIRWASYAWNDIKHHTRDLASCKLLIAIKGLICWITCLNLIQTCWKRSIWSSMVYVIISDRHAFLFGLAWCLIMVFGLLICIERSCKHLLISVFCLWCNFSDGDISLCLHPNEHRLAWMHKRVYFIDHFLLSAK